MLLAYLVCDVHELLKRPILLCGAAVFVRFKSPAVDAVDVIENYMKVRVVFVDVAGHEILIFAFEELLTYLLTELQCSLRCDLPRLETDDEVLGENRTFTCPVFPNLSKIMTCLQRIGATTFCYDKPAVVGLFGVGDVVQCCKVISRD